MATGGKKAILEFLGTGTSTGVPVVGCSCEVCRSPDPHDKRLRASVLISRGVKNLVIDTTPEFRLQCLRAGVKRLDAVVLTHEHADHVNGFDDVRPFSTFRHRVLPVWAASDVITCMRSRFDYIWNAKQKGGGLPDVAFREIAGPFEAVGLEVTPIPIKHGILDILGFRIGDLAYLTDISALPDASLPLLRDLGTLVISCARLGFHLTHLSVPGTIRMHRLLKPKQTFLTHIAHFTSHKQLIELLPADMTPAHDGLKLEINL